MENCSTNCWKFSKIRYHSPLERTLKRSTYIPETLKVHDIKNVLKKYLNIEKSPKHQNTKDRENLGIFQTFPEKNLFSSPKDLKSKETQFKTQGSRLRANTPQLKIKKNKKGMLRGEKSLVIKKRNGNYQGSAQNCKRKMDSEKRFLNSNYSSYSDIYQGLIQRIPLVY